MADDNCSVNENKLNNLIMRFQTLPQNLVNKYAKDILKKALKETNARKQLQSYINSSFKVRSGTYRKSVSSVKVSRVRSDHNRVVSYIYFLPVDKIKRKAKRPGKKDAMMIQPRTLTHWFNAGTRSHAVGKGSRLAADRIVQQLWYNKKQISLGRARINYAKAKSEKQRQRFYEQMIRIENQLKNQFKGRRTDKQSGTKVKGITARHFIDAIQARASAQGQRIVIDALQHDVIDYLNN